jgi:hypothetical protein
VATFSLQRRRKGQGVVIGSSGCGRMALLALSLAAVLQASCASSKGPSLDSASPLDLQFAAAAPTWDLNHDGDITCDEWKTYAGGLFAEADANKDGSLTRDEFAAMAREDRLFEAANFDYFDANRDGRVTLSEIVDRPNPAFALLDKNGDCVISRDEKAREGGAGKAGKGQGRRSKQQP